MPESPILTRLPQRSSTLVRHNAGPPASVQGSIAHRSCTCVFTYNNPGCQLNVLAADASMTEKDTCLAVITNHNRVHGGASGRPAGQYRQNIAQDTMLDRGLPRRVGRCPGE
jgi:hypothetical protein